MHIAKHPYDLCLKRPLFVKVAFLNKFTNLEVIGD